MENLDSLIQNQETHLNELENLKRSLRSGQTACGSEKANNKTDDIQTTLEQINEEIETIYREISILKIRRLMNV